MSAFTWRGLLLLAACLLFTFCSAAEDTLLHEHDLVSRAKSYPKKLKHVSDKAHGTIMGLTVVLVLPLGALSWRILDRVFSPRALLWIHIGCQTLGVAMLVTGFSLGLWVAVLHDELYDNDLMGHTFLGTIVVGLFLIQPLVGAWHHRLYKATKTNNFLRQGHIWFGRILLLLAIVNGGTGVVFGANTPNGLKVYEALAALVGSVYIGAVALWYFNKRTGGGVESSGSEVETGAGGEKQEA